MKRKKDYSDFDIISFLEDNDVEHSFSGKNISKGWAGIACPFCGGHGYHGGVNLNHKTFSCWQCGESASPPKLVKQILDCSWAEAFDIVRKYSKPDIEAPQKELPITQRSSRITLPPLSGPLIGPGGEYLRSRGFDPEVIETKYGVKETGFLGDYKFRLVIPVYLNNNLVTFTTRDYTEKAKPKYQAQPPEDAAVPIKNCLYNIDTVRDQVIIVEGPADVWRMGDGSVALFGTACSPAQQQLLLNKHLKRAFILLDPETKKPADKLYYSLVSFIREIRIIELEDKDPGELTQEEAMNLKLQFF